MTHSHFQGYYLFNIPSWFPCCYKFARQVAPADAFWDTADDCVLLADSSWQQQKFPFWRVLSLFNPPSVRIIMKGTQNNHHYAFSPFVRFATSFSHHVSGGSWGNPMRKSGLEKTVVTLTRIVILPSFGGCLSWDC